MSETKVRIVNSARDGYLLKWTTPRGKERQAACVGKTQRTREAARKAKQQEINDTAREETWSGYYADYKTLHLSEMSKSHRDKCDMMDRRLITAANAMGIDPLMCSDISPKLMMRVEAMVKSSGVEPAAVSSYLGTLWGVISWGQDRGVLPDFRRPRKRRGKAAKAATRKSKGRALTDDEFKRLIKMIPKACRQSEAPEGFIHATYAAKMLGMRKSECWLFSWEPIENTHYPVRLNGSNPAILFSAEQKSGEESEVPMTPEAVAWLKSLPRHGTPWVCRTYGPKGWHLTPDRLGRVIADAGRLAEIVVKRTVKSDGRIKTKNASLHDLRRTYAKAMMQHLDVVDTTKMTRHADASVLLDYYGDSATPELFKKVCGGFSGGSSDDKSSSEDKKTR